MRMTKSQAILIAKFVEEIRPDWKFHGVMAALGKAAEMGSSSAVAIAAITAATDPDCTTPGVIPTDGSHWPTWSAARQETDDERNRRRTREIAHRRVLDELRRAVDRRDPDSSHRGYLAATQELQRRRTDEEPAG
jgi:hypothetical protein